MVEKIEKSLQELDFASLRGRLHRKLFEMVSRLQAATDILPEDRQ
jgi:hypothetical protein